MNKKLKKALSRVVWWVFEKEYSRQKLNEIFKEIYRLLLPTLERQINYSYKYNGEWMPRLTTHPEGNAWSKYNRSV